MTTRCKFRCIRVSKTENYNKTVLYGVEMSPVYGNGDPNHENTKFWTATPSGHFKLECIVPDLFEVGKEYYLDISEAD